MTYSKTDLSKLLSVASQAVLRAGRFLSRAEGDVRKIETDLGRDVKISADRVAEKIVVDHLMRRAPFGILTEESGLISKGRPEEPTWIVDPLDGTINFLRGIPVCCVSVGLWVGAEPVLGAVYDFNKAELFLGLANGGAWLNGRSMKVSGICRNDKAVMLTGFPAKTDFSAGALAPFLNDIRRYRKVRLLGTAALSLAYVACGRADAYYEKDIMPWDVAAGISIVLGAGGRCDVANPGGKGTLTVYASNGRLPRKRRIKR